jgi:Leucine-rich repeat (LRR) protein
MMFLFSGCADKDNKIMVEISDANFKSYLLENFDKNGDGNISLSEAKGIREINCSGMDIENLDGIEKFENLESLDCSNNKLDELEIRYNRKLNKVVCNGNNVPLTIYIGMKSLLRNANIQKPKDNEPPQTANMAVKPLDDSKVTYDHDKTNIYLSFDD